MKKLWLCLAVLLALAAWGGAAPSVSAQASGKISGIVSGPNGPIAGVTVNIVNNAGVVVGTAVTTSTGAYTVGNLPVGTYTIQVVNTNGRVAGTGVGTVTAGAPAAVVNLTITSSQLAPAAVAAGGGGGMGTTTKIVLVTAAVAAAGILIVVANKDDTSPTR
ncbi:MAG: carboxypeptidase-like regulatory domain-containing protein [Acidobacteriota bacterium]